MHTAAYESQLEVYEMGSAVWKSDAYFSPQAKLRPALTSSKLVW
jgi:hypothetical protein